MLLWSAKSNESSHTVIELDFDPTQTIHTYNLVVNEDEDMVDKVGRHNTPIYTTVVLNVRGRVTSTFSENTWYILHNLLGVVGSPTVADIWSILSRFKYAYILCH